MRLRNTSYRLSLLMFLGLLGNIGSIKAAQNTFEGDITLKDTTSCSIIDGHWANDVCTLNNDISLQINSDQILTIPLGTRLDIEGIIINEGTIANGGGINNFGEIRNSGTLTNRSSGIINNTTRNIATSNFRATINNSDSGTVDNVGEIDNYSIINNSGSFDNIGQISNSGRINNDGLISNSGTINNFNTIDNGGRIDDKGTIKNTGNIIKREPTSTPTPILTAKDTMCNTLDAFLMQVKTGSGKALTTEQTQQLLDNTKQSKTILECSQ